MLNYVVLSTLMLFVIVLWRTNHKSSVYLLFSKKSVKVFLYLLGLFISGLPMGLMFFFKLYAVWNSYVSLTELLALQLVIFNVVTIIFYLETTNSLISFKCENKEKQKFLYLTSDNMYYFVLLCFCVFIINFFSFLVVPILL